MTIQVGIVSEFDAKGFRQAEAATTKLNKSINNLGKAVIGVFAADKILSYSKASVLAYANDQKGAALLANQLKNLGLAYSSIPVEKFIASMQEQTGILDDELRPAFAQLARVTGSVAKSQELMALAFDTSRGAGVSFQQAVDAISQAYVGNTRGLRALNIGLTQAELKTAKFDDILKVLQNKFRGAGAASVETFAGKIDLLKVAAANAQETIGKGFVDAFQTLADDKNFNSVINSINNMALSVADTIRGLGLVLNEIDNKTPSWIKQLFKWSTSLGIIPWLNNLGKQQRAMDPMASVGTSYQSIKAAEKQAAAAQAAALKAEKDKLKVLTAQSAQKKAQAAIDKANALLAKASEQFNLEGIQIQAALMNQSLTIEERKRLEVKQAIFNLEQALAQKDQERIAAATALLEKLLGQMTVLNQQQDILKQMYELFAKLGVNKDLINLLNLEDALNLINQMAVLGQMAIPANFPKPTMTMVTKQEAAAALAAATTPEAMAWTAHEQQMAANRASFLNVPTTTAPVTPVVVNVTDNATKLVDVVVTTLQDQSASGISTRIARNTGGYNW